MDPLARLGARLGAALTGAGTDDDRLLLLHTITDLTALIAASATAAGILYLLARRRDFDFRFLLLITAAALAAAAVGNGVSLWHLVHPDRWFTGWMVLAAAACGLGAATVFWMQLPDLARLPSGRQLRRANAGLTRDNWDLQRKTQRAQDEAQITRDALERMAGAAALLSAEGRWLQANAALAQLFGLGIADLHTREPRDLFGENLAGADRELTEERTMTVGGKHRRLHWRVTPLLDREGRLRARLLQPLHTAGDAAPTRQLEAQLTEQTRRAEEAIALMQQGLADKEKGDAELARRAEQLERSAAQLERLGSRLTELTGSDPATGLVSSQALAGRLDSALALAKRYGDRFAVLVAAADPIDDLSSGDAALLGALGAVLQAELRETDTAARCDDERICVLLPQTGAAEAARLAERVRRRLAGTPLSMPDGRTLRLSCCVGTAEWKPGQGLGEVLGQAAEALRNARASGRDSVALG